MYQRRLRAEATNKPKERGKRLNSRFKGNHFRKMQSKYWMQRKIALLYQTNNGGKRY